MQGKIKNLNDKIKEMNYKEMCKELDLMNAVESYLKTECYESYEKNNLKEAFERAKQDNSVRVEIMNIIDEFLFDDNSEKICFRQ